METKFTPRELGYFFPAEFAPQTATWLSWPHKEASWPGKIASIYNPYAEFILQLADHQKVCLNVSDGQMEAFARQQIAESSFGRSCTNLAERIQNIHFYHHPTNDAWCRDHGPAFLKHQTRGDLVIVDWNYNAWGDKYPPYDLDDIIPTRVGEALGLPVFHPGIVMEGGSVDFNGTGTVLTTTACLLNPNRNPACTKSQIENYLIEYYGVEHILWLDEGIEGDDTDGHIDDIARFVAEDRVITVVERNASDDNYHVLRQNLQMLRKMELADGRRLEVVELPMPAAVIYDGQRLPASYANFYISSEKVIVPTFRDDKNDVEALEIIQECFPERTVIGIDSVDIIWGLGSFHCLSQQQPA